MIKIQVIICKCGSTIAAARVPFCYQDAEWQKDMRKYVKQGSTVEIIESGSFSSLEKCRCKEIELENKKAMGPTLFKE